MEEIAEPLNPETIDEVEESVISEHVTDEDRRLGGKKELPTILILSAGPLISQLTNALYGIINTIWVSKAIGDKALTAISTYNNFDTIGRAFGVFLQVTAAAKISSLIGSGQQAEATQVFSDLLRLIVVCWAATAGIFIPCAKPCAKWFGAEEDIIQLGYDFIFPNLMLTFIPCIYLLGCGCLQAEGRSWTFCIFQVTALVSNMFIFCPILLLVVKTGIAGVAYANGLAELIPGIIIIVFFYRGKYGIKPHPRELLKKFTPHTWAACKVGFSQFLYQISLALPGIIIRKYFGLASGGDRVIFDNVMAGFNTFCRLWGLVASVTNAMTIGFIPAASYAFGAKRFKRILHLLLHTIWISVTWNLLTQIFTCGFPRMMSSIFSKTKEYLDWGEIIVRNGNLMSFLSPCPIIAQALLQSQQKGGLATLLSFLTQLIPLPIITTILYFTNKTDIGRLNYCYPIQNAWQALVSIPFFYLTLRQVVKIAKDKEAISNIAKDETLSEMQKSKSTQFLDAEDTPDGNNDQPEDSGISEL